MKKEKSIWLFLLLLMMGIVLGGVIGELLGKYPSLEFLKYGKQFGINPNQPFQIDLSIIKMSFGVTFNLTVATIVGIVLALVVYKKI